MSRNKRLIFLHRKRQFILAENPKIFDSQEFFDSYEKAYLRPNFKTRILSFAGGTSIYLQEKMQLASFDVKEQASDLEIRNELSTFHIFENRLEFCSRLAYLLQQYDSESPEKILSACHPNVFYVRGIEDGVFDVVVSWQEKERDGGDKWDISAEEEQAYHPQLESRFKWMAGTRVFDRNEEAYYIPWSRRQIK